MEELGYGPRSSKEQMKRRRSPRSIGQRDPSLRWPHLYDILRSKGYSKEKAARIANSRLKYRKKGRLQGLPYKQADNPSALAKVRKEQESKRKSRTASALVAACHSRSCAPPPVGSGGSTGQSLSSASRAKAAASRSKHAQTNTSAYPVDTIKTKRPSDRNPEAPGAGDRSAVRGHKGQAGDQPERRIPRKGETVDIYRDLGRGREHKRGFPDGDAFSVRHASALPGENTSLVVASTTGIILNAGRPSWAHSAKAAAEATGKRGVHGFIRGEVESYVNPAKLRQMVDTDPSWKKVTYYPGTQDFFDPGTRQRFVGSDKVALVNGEFFAKNPKYVAETAPISPIELKVQQVKRGALNASSAEFACYDASCAPPPVGTGGSKSKGGGTHQIITAAEARGDSKPVSAEEFQRLASIGQAKYDKMKENTSSIDGLDDPENWDSLKKATYQEVQAEWGGATIDAHTGKALPQGANKWAMTVKDPGMETHSIKIGVSEDEFDAAMDAAREKFRSVLERQDHYLGVFRDDDVGRIDFDPVMVVDNLSDVHTIGAATRNIGGAYNFADGNGYWPPHVKDS